MGEINNVEEQGIEKEIIQDKAKLEEKIATLTARRDELSSKIAIARMSNNRTNLYNALLTLYTSVCGLIVSYEAALWAFGVCVPFVIAESLNNGHKVLDIRDDIASVNETLTMYRR